MVRNLGPLGADQVMRMLHVDIQNFRMVYCRS